MRLHSIYLSVIIAVVVITFSSCNKDNEDITIPQQTYTELTLNMKHLIGNQEIDYDNIQYTNDFGNNYSVIILRYFVSDFRFLKADGTSVFIDQEFYVDARDVTTTSIIPATKLPYGNYTSVSFVFGLNLKKNVDGAFPDAPENAMEWPLPLGGGYHYMKLEGKVDSAGTINNFQAHTGATNGNSNFINITLPASSFTADQESLALNIVMDINNWWTNPFTLDLNEMTMVMGNQDMQEKLKANGQDIFSIEFLK